jgi:hypothetical protein
MNDRLSNFRHEVNSKKRHINEGYRVISKRSTEKRLNCGGNLKKFRRAYLMEQLVSWQMDIFKSIHKRFKDRVTVARVDAYE